MPLSEREPNECETFFKFSWNFWSFFFFCSIYANKKNTKSNIWPEYLVLQKWSSVPYISVCVPLHFIFQLISCIMMPLKACHKPHDCWQLFVLSHFDRRCQHLTGRTQIKVDQNDDSVFLNYRTRLEDIHRTSMIYAVKNHKAMRQWIKVGWLGFVLQIWNHLSLFVLCLLERRTAFCASFHQPEAQIALGWRCCEIARTGYFQPRTRSCR